MNEIKKVVHKKLGNQQAWGTYTDGTIELDQRLKGKKHLEVSIHEYLHHINPEWSETKVTKEAKKFAKYLWNLKYRRIDDTEKQPKT